ncbi:AmmeMemoRadiSam system protein B [Pyrodictium abyssi]|uniref:MEMO1 family protein PABY_20540 n=1 Tax=Pyrodictium abyssi TaxID=54256 RepID=A0ABN6ZQG0_9CREN|nr:AmmeMemoRadiSam system protein B [Pyrodictium abyssi]
MAIYSGRIIGGKRLPAVAGMFYEADAEALKAQIEWAFRHPLGPGKLPVVSDERQPLSKGFVVPHAGYMYSGPIAANSYFQMAAEGPAETYVIIGPNHTGLGEIVSVYPGGAWVTPLGEVEVDTELARAIVGASSFAAPDEKAHLYEHSVEVQVPFLQYMFGDRFRIVPIVVYEQTPEIAEDLGKAILEAAEKTGRDIVVIASSDFTHYEPHDVAVAKDKLAIEAILELDPLKLYQTIQKHSISMCGPGPVMAMLYYARGAGASSAKLLRYATSGDVAGDKSSVVGYASIQVY